MTLAAAYGGAAQPRWRATPSAQNRWSAEVHCHPITARPLTSVAPSRGCRGRTTWRELSSRGSPQVNSASPSARVKRLVQVDPLAKAGLPVGSRTGASTVGSGGNSNHFRVGSAVRLPWSRFQSPPHQTQHADSRPSPGPLSGSCLRSLLPVGCSNSPRSRFSTAASISGVSTVLRCRLLC